MSGRVDALVELSLSQRNMSRSFMVYTRHHDTATSPAIYPRVDQVKAMTPRCPTGADPRVGAKARAKGKAKAKAQGFVPGAPASSSGV